MINNKTLDITSGVTVKNKLYFKTYRAAPGLYCYDMLTKNLQVIEEPLEINAAWDKYSYNGAEKVDKYILFIPYFGKHFIFLNIENNQVIYFQKEKNAIYYTAVEFEKKVFVFSEKIEDTIVFDLNDFSHSYPFESQSYRIKLSCAQVGMTESKVIISTEEPDCIAEIDLNICSVCYKDIEKRGVHYNLVIPYEDGFILTGDQQVILLWDGEENCKFINLVEEGARQEIPWKALFTNAVVVNDKVYFGPFNYKSLVSLDLKKMIVDYLYEMQGQEMASLIEMDKSLLLSVIEDDMPKKNMIYKYDGSMDDYNRLELNERFKFPGAQKEYSNVALKYFIEDILNN